MSEQSSPQKSFWDALRQKKPPLANVTPEENPYLDNEPLPEVIAQRAEEAQKHIQRLLPEAYVPTGIFEIGTGIGGVTQALRTLYPNVPFLGIDNDPRPHVRAAAEANHVENFFQEDLIQIPPARLQQVFAENHVDTVVALRTSGYLVDHMRKILPEIGFNGHFLFSLIGRTGDDDQKAEALRWMIQVQQLHGKSELQTRETPRGIMSETRIDLLFGDATNRNQKRESLSTVSS